MPTTEMQIGKNGLNEGTISWLVNAFKTHEIIKVRILKSAGHDREKMREMASEIVEKLGDKYTCRTIGFTIILRKWRKARK